MVHSFARNPYNMATYRSKPSTVQAIPVFEVIVAYGSDPSKLPQWVRDAYERGSIRAITSKGCTVSEPCSLPVHADEQAMIVNRSGKVSVLSPEEFANEFEPV